MSIYQRIKDLAGQKNISIRELEHILNFSNGTVSKWDDNANSEKSQSVADFFNVSTDYLLGRDKPVDKRVDLADDDVIMTFEGKEIPPEDIELMRRLLRGGKN